MDFYKILITGEKIAIPAAENFATGSGAVLDFHGIVRPLEKGRPIAGIHYEAHPRMAEPVLKRIVTDAASDSALIACELVHRVGFVPAGEISLFLRVATAHREAAYALNRSIVEVLKQRAPIWKRPIFEA